MPQHKRHWIQFQEPYPKDVYLDGQPVPLCVEVQEGDGLDGYVRCYVPMRGNESHFLLQRDPDGGRSPVEVVVHGQVRMEFESHEAGER